MDITLLPCELQSPFSNGAVTLLEGATKKYIALIAVAV